MMKMKLAQLYLTLCDPIDYIVHGILQARILEWVAFPFSRGSSQPRNGTGVSCIAGRFYTKWVIREGTGCEKKKKKSERMEIENLLELLNKCSDGPLRWNYAKIRKRKGVTLLDTWIKICSRKGKKKRAIRYWSSCNRGDEVRNIKYGHTMRAFNATVWTVVISIENGR